MYAWRIHEYGGPECLVRETVPRPEPAEGEILVRVRAASLNPIDWKMRQGLLRQVLPMVLPVTLGRDCVGEVVSVGSGVKDLVPGDRVLGVAAHGHDGTHADFACLPAAQAARVPDGVSDEAAVCMGVSGLSAFIPLIEVANVGEGRRVLVHAGSGSVGAHAIQIAKLAGAEVIATCGPGNLEYVRSLGADRAIDYTAEDLAANVGEVDVALDTLGGEANARTFSVMKPGGLIVALSALPLLASPRADVRCELVRIIPTRDRLLRLLGWAAERRIKPQVGKTFALAEAPAAYALSQTGHARGKIVLLA